MQKIMKFSLGVLMTLILLGCIGQETVEEPGEIEELQLENAISLSQLYFEREDFIGQKVWALGFYGDDRFTDDGVGFLVYDFYLLIIDEQLPPYSFVRLDGELPPYEMNGAEILVYGEVKDFSETYNAFTVYPTPLITVEDYQIVTPPEFEPVEGSYSTLLGVSSDSPRKLLEWVKGLFFNYTNGHSSKGTRAGKGDRALVICGGIDRNNNHKRDKDDVAAAYKKLIDLGFSDGQIDVLHDDGEAIKVNGKNIVDSKVTIEKIKKALDQYKDKMPASSTLTIFVTDHGIGYNPDMGYHPTFGAKTGSSDENKNGKTYPENELKIDCKALNKKTNEWDTDKDGKNDVRARWDGTKYVVEKKKDSTWKKIGEDKNGDNVIDKNDGGIDWNSDGDTNDKAGFHEGICLWGKEILWDDELANMLKPLHQKGIHILAEIHTCFSGGFIENLEGIVQKVVTFSGEDTLHYSIGYKNGKWYSASERAFIEKLTGIDVASWDDSFEEGKKADEEAWKNWKKRVPGKKDEYYQQYKNEYRKWETSFHNSKSIFSEEDGDYIIVIEIPEDLAGKVYDIEIIYGLQKPRWTQGKIEGIPEGFSKEEIPGGIRIKSKNPFPSKPLIVKIRGEKNVENLRIELTDGGHNNIGYVMPEKVPNWLLECTITLSTSTGREYREASLAEQGQVLNKPESQYIEDMRADLSIYINSTHPSVTDEMRECARRLRDYLDSSSVSQEEKERLARIYWENIKKIISS